MSVEQISFRDGRLFSDLFLDLAEEKAELRKFVRDFVSAAAVKSSLSAFDLPVHTRQVLAGELTNQYTSFTVHPSVTENIAALASENTYTVCTGHQLCLFTGPAYFMYKIISCIKTCQQLNLEIPEKKFVPVYWMATEDHDLEEINHTYVYGKKIQWAIEGKGRAGELSAAGLRVLIDELSVLLGGGEEAKKITDLLTAAAAFKTLSGFMRHVVNELFGKYGLIVLDGNAASLKVLFADEIEQELRERTSFAEVNNTISSLHALGYEAQVTPREINLFYAEEQVRERIVEKNGVYEVLNTEKKFSAEQLLEVLKKSPEKFSPNVVLRPLYQQKILPNVVYCGGPGELSYWMQYKSMFDQRKISFPFLLARNFVLLLDGKSAEKWKKLGFEMKDLFLPEEELIKRFVRSQSGEISLASQKAELEKIYSELEVKAGDTDKTLVNFVLAEKQKSLNSIGAIESKLNKALKQKHETGITQISTVLSKVFPAGTFQERRENFFSFAAGRGTNFLDELMVALPSPLENKSITVLIV